MQRSIGGDFSPMSHPCEISGINDLQIIIFAADFPERKTDLNDRRKLIVDAIKTILPSEIRGFVWILLPPSSFGEF